MTTNYKIQLPKKLKSQLIKVKKSNNLKNLNK